MYYRLSVKNLSDRIFNVARCESRQKGNLLSAVDLICSIRVLSLHCRKKSDLANIVGTLETEPNTEVVVVEDGDGRNVDFRLIKEERNPFFDRNTLSLSA